jgi:glutathionyl-hydroquinone reductase
MHGGNILSYASKNGEFNRQQSQFRNWISNDEGAEFPAEKDRYHLYVSYACPWGKCYFSFLSEVLLVLIRDS